MILVIIALCGNENISTQKFPRTLMQFIHKHYYTVYWRWLHINPFSRDWVHANIITTCTVGQLWLFSYRHLQGQHSRKWRACSMYGNTLWHVNSHSFACHPLGSSYKLLILCKSMLEWNYLFQFPPPHRACATMQYRIFNEENLLYIHNSIVDVTQHKYIHRSVT